MHPEWFLTNIDRYASYDRSEPKVFIGEFASWGNKYKNALAEACYMTEVENNADVVSLACYAPLFANVDYLNWTPDMIWFDNYRSYCTPNYYVQQMFMVNQSEYVVKTEMASDINDEPIGLGKISGRMGVSLLHSAAEFYDVKIDGEIQTEIYSANSAKWVTEDGKFTFDEVSDNLTAIEFPPILNGAKLTMKAKKLGGKEGFRIIFGAEKRNYYYFWEIGGWNNDVSAVNKMCGEKSAGVTVGKRVTVEVGREYEISIEAKDHHFICRLDGEVYHDFTEKEAMIKPLYYTAGVSGDTTVIKAANYREADYTTEIRLDKKASRVKITEFISEDLEAENSFEKPVNAAPADKSMAVDGESFTYTFPKKSVMVLEII